jgi:hypothetical protein
MLVGRAERGQIGLASLTGRIETVPSPGEGFLPELSAHQVRGEATVAAVAVGKWVDQNQAVVKASGEFVGRVGFVSEPVGNVAEEFS